jgi:hypothetical protein
MLALNYLLLIDTMVGRMSDARRREAELLEAARARGVVTDLALAKMQVLMVHWRRREPEAVVERSRELEELCAEHKLELFGAGATTWRGWAGAVTADRAGDRAEAIALLREGIRRSIATGNFAARWHLCLLAEAEAAAGNLGGRSPRSTTCAPPAATTRSGSRRGDLLVQQGGDLDAAEASYREAIEGSRAMGAFLFELRAATGLARLLGRRGRAGEARQLLAPVCARFPEGHDLLDAREAEALLDELARGSG